MCADLYWCFACPKQTHGPDGAPFGPERHTCAPLRVWFQEALSIHGAVADVILFFGECGKD